MGTGRRAVTATLAALLVILAGCRDSRRLNAADSVPVTTSTSTSEVPAVTAGAPIPPTTAAPKSVLQPACIPESDPTDYNGARGQEVGSKQNELQADVQTVRAYGEGHADEFTSVAFDNYPAVIVVGYFTGHLDAHRAALRRQLQHPDQFEVRQAVLSDRERARRQQSLIDNPQMQTEMRMSGSGANGALTVSLAATKAGRAIAQDLRAKWGDTVCLELAGHPYPKGSRPDADICGAGEAKTDRNPDVELTLIPDPPSIARGAAGNGVARITNHGTTTISGLTGSRLVVAVVSPGSTTQVGTVVEGSTDVGRPFSAEPGKTIEIPIRFGTDDCRANADYALPPGQYGLSAYLAGAGRSDEAPLTVLAD